MDWRDRERKVEVQEIQKIFGKRKGRKKGERQEKKKQEVFRQKTLRSPEGKKESGKEWI